MIMTSDAMDIGDYLASGGKLTSPGNAPPRYRAELMRMMAIFVDSELAGAAGFADVINAGPGVKERIAAARIVLEKTDHAGRVLRIMGEFGANTDRYVTHHPWTHRLPRNAALDGKRLGEDMRLPVFNYPLAGWGDAMMMNLLMGEATYLQLSDYQGLSYQPLGDVFREITPVERRHAELAYEGLEKLGASEALQSSADYWWPRVAASFGRGNSQRDATLRKFGLRRSPSDDLLAGWQASAGEKLTSLGLDPPA